MTAEEALVSVVVPTRNRLPLLREAVASVRGQTSGAWELLVVDDASTDGTSDWLSSLGDPRVKPIRLHEHAERSAARNRGLADATGRFVLFLDDDDRLTPGALAALVSALERAPASPAAAGAKEVVDDAGNRKRWVHPRKPLQRHLGDDVIFGWVATPGECLWRTQALRDLGGWREGLSHAEDQELFLRLARMAPLAVTPETVLEYRHHHGQVRDPEAAPIELRLREEHIAALPAHARGRARRVLRARRRYHDALDAFAADRPARALLAALAASRLAPRLLVSPLVGSLLRRLLLRSLLGALVGRRARGAVKRLVWARRSRRGTAVRLDDWRMEP